MDIDELTPAELKAMLREALDELQGTPAWYRITGMPFPNVAD